MMLVINIDEARRQNTTLNKIKQTLSMYKLEEAELIIFNIIGQYKNIERMERIVEFFSKALGKKIEIRC